MKLRLNSRDKVALYTQLSVILFEVLTGEINDAAATAKALILVSDLLMRLSDKELQAQSEKQG